MQNLVQVLIAFWLSLSSLSTARILVDVLLEKFLLVTPAQ